MTRPESSAAAAAPEAAGPKSDLSQNIIKMLEILEAMKRSKTAVDGKQSMRKFYPSLAEMPNPEEEDVLMRKMSGLLVANLSSHITGSASLRTIEAAIKREQRRAEGREQKLLNEEEADDLVKGLQMMSGAEVFSDFAQFTRLYDTLGRVVNGNLGSERGQSLAQTAEEITVAAHIEGVTHLEIQTAKLLGEGVPAVQEGCAAGTKKAWEKNLAFDVKLALSLYGSGIIPKPGAKEAEIIKMMRLTGTKEEQRAQIDRYRKGVENFENAIKQDQTVPIAAIDFCGNEKKPRNEAEIKFGSSAKLPITITVGEERPENYKEKGKEAFCPIQATHEALKLNPERLINSVQFVRMWWIQRKLESQKASGVSKPLTIAETQMLEDFNKLSPKSIRMINEVAEEIRSKNIGIVLCLSGLVKLGCVDSMEGILLPQMLDAGFMVTIATDNPTLFDTSAAKEMFRAAHIPGMTVEHMQQIVDNGIEMSFSDAREKEKMRFVAKQRFLAAKLHEVMPSKSTAEAAVRDAAPSGAAARASAEAPARGFLHTDSGSLLY